MIQSNMTKIFTRRFLFRYLRSTKGEALALYRGDMDLNKCNVSITKLLTGKTEGKAIEITTPKNKSSVRKILLPNNLIGQLKKYKNNIEKFNEKDFLFGGKSPLSETTISRKFSNYTKLSGNIHIRIHDLRYFHASLLISTAKIL